MHGPGPQPDEAAPPPAPTNGRPTLQDVLTVVNDSKRDVLERIHDLREDFVSFRSNHEQRHAINAQEHAESLTEMRKRMDAYDLAKARREGALGLLRWGLDLLGRNWKLIAVALLAALAWLDRIQLTVAAP